MHSEKEFCDSLRDNSEKPYSKFDNTSQQYFISWGWLGSWADWDLGLTGILDWLGSMDDRDLARSQVTE